MKRVYRRVNYKEFTDFIFSKKGEWYFYDDFQIFFVSSVFARNDDIRCTTCHIKAAYSKIEDDEFKYYVIKYLLWRESTYYNT